MSVEAFLTKWLSGNANVRKSVGNRIYPVELPQGAGVPSLTYYKVSEEGQKTLNGLSGLTRTRMAIDCWATSYSDANALAKIIRGNVTTPGLDGFRGMLAGIFVQKCSCNIGMDAIEKPVHGDQSGVKHCMLDLEITYEDVEASVFADSEPYEEPEL